MAVPAVAGAQQCPEANPSYTDACGPTFVLPPWGDGGGWTDPSKYSTIQLADVNGDGKDELIARNDQGLEIFWFDTTVGQWRPQADADGVQQVLTDFRSPLPTEAIRRPGPTPSTTRRSRPPTSMASRARRSWLASGTACASTSTRHRRAAGARRRHVAADRDGRAVHRRRRLRQRRAVLDDPGRAASRRGAGALFARQHSTSFARPADPCSSRWDGSGVDGDGLPHDMGLLLRLHRSELLAAVVLPDAADRRSRSAGSLRNPPPTTAPRSSAAPALGRDVGHRRSRAMELLNEDYDFTPDGLPPFGDAGTTPAILDCPFSAGGATGPGSGDCVGSSPSYYETLQAADVDGVPGDELIARASDGLRVRKWEPGSSGGSWDALPTLTALAARAAASRRAMWGSIRTGDIDGDGKQEVLALDGTALQAWSYDRTAKAWSRLQPSTALALTGNWMTQPEYYSTIQTGDVDGDGNDDVVARGPFGIRTWFYDRRRTGGWERYLPDGYPALPHGHGTAGHREAERVRRAERARPAEGRHHLGQAPRRVDGGDPAGPDDACRPARRPAQGARRQLPGGESDEPTRRRSTPRVCRRPGAPGTTRTSGRRSSTRCSARPTSPSRWSATSAISRRSARACSSPRADRCRRSAPTCSSPARPAPPRTSTCRASSPASPGSPRRSPVW